MNPPAPPANPTNVPSPDPTVTEPAASAPLPAAFAKQDYTGRTLGDFRLIRRVGEGGMGQVYLAEQVSLQRRVALKLLRPDLLTNETFLKRFKAEAKAVAQLAHPNIVQVHAVGEEQGLHFMALEYVEGLNLKDYLTRKGPPELPVALAIMRQVAAALMKSAELGIVHRDIKPENLLVTRKVEIKVTDFGLSRMVGEELHLTQTGTTMGTPLYMSPEQIMGEPVDPRSDLYSFGATCYHLLTGQPPFTGENAMAVGLKHLADTPAPLETLRPGLPADLVKLVNQLLAKKPADRPPTAREVWKEIRRIQDSLSATTGTPPSTHEPGEEDTLETAAAPTLGSLPRAETMIARRPWRSWLGPVVLGSLGVAVVGGSLMGFLLRGDHSGKLATSSSHATTPVPTAASASVPAKPRPTRTVSTKPPPKRNPLTADIEDELLKRIEATKNADRQKDALQFTDGFNDRAKLMRLYVMDLDDETLVKARRFATAEARSGVNEPFRAVGHVGLAAIFAYEGKTAESIDQLERAFFMKDKPPRRPLVHRLLTRNRDLQDVILATLRTDEKQGALTKDLKDLKDEIERLRKEANEKRPGKVLPSRGEGLPKE